MRFLVLFLPLLINFGYAARFDVISANFPMSQHDLDEHYENVPLSLNRQIADYHAICKTDERLLLSRIQKLKNICLYCLDVDVSNCEQVFSEAVGKYNYLKELYRNLRIFSRNPVAGFVAHFFLSPSGRIPIFMKELEDYRCVIDPYNNDYGARNFFKIWKSKLKTENLPSFWMWLEQFKRTDYPSDSTSPIVAKFSEGKICIGEEKIRSGMFNYVVDFQKNILLSASGKHTLLSKGKPVFGAGELRVRDGLITEINALSGHYLPSADDMLQSIRLFKEQGALFSSNCVVRFIDTYKIAENCSWDGDSFYSLPVISVHDERAFSIMPLHLFEVYANKKFPKVMWTSGDGVHPEFKLFLGHTHVGNLRFANYQLHRNFSFYSYLQGKLFLLMAPPCTGKTTIVTHLKLKNIADVQYTSHDEILETIFKKCVLSAATGKIRTCIEKLMASGIQVEQLVEFPDILALYLPPHFNQEEITKFQTDLRALSEKITGDTIIMEIEKAIIPLLSAGKTVIVDAVEAKREVFTMALFKNFVRCDTRCLTLYCTPEKIIDRMNSRNRLALSSQHISDIRNFPFRQILEFAEVFPKYRQKLMMDLAFPHHSATALQIFLDNYPEEIKVQLKSGQEIYAKLKSEAQTASEEEKFFISSVPQIHIDNSFITVESVCEIIKSLLGS